MTEARILIVEDEPVSAMTLSRSLKNLEYEVVGTVTSGEACVRMAEESKPDLVIMDINLAGKTDGIEAADRIRSRFDIPVVYLTGYGEKGILERAKKTEPYGYLGKPVSPFEMRGTIETALYKHQMEKRLRESETRYRQIVDNANDSVHKTDVQGFFVLVNPVTVLRTGYSEEELIGKHFLELIHPEYREEAGKSFASQFADRIPEAYYEFPIVTKRGETIWIGQNSLMLMEGERVVGFQSIARDITDRKKAEEAQQESHERFKTVMDSLDAAVYVADMDTYEILFINQRMRDLFGDVEGRTCWKSVYHGQSSPCEFCSNDRLIDDRGEPTGLHVWETENRTAGGWWELRDRAIRWTDGRLVRLQIASEITERKRADEALKNTLARLQQTNVETQALLEGSKAVLKRKDFETACRETFDLCRKAIGATGGYVGLLSEDKTENEIVFLESGGLDCTVDPSLPMPIRGIRGVAYRTGRPVYDNDFSNSKWMKFMPAGHSRLNNVLFAPLKIGGKTVGLMGLANKPGGVNERDAQLAEAFSEFAAIALHNARTEEALKESRKWYRALLGAIPDPVVVYDRDGKATYINDAFTKTYGWNPEEILGRKIDFVPAEETQKTREGLERLFRGESRLMESKRFTKSGDLLDVQLRGAILLDEGGNISHNIVIHHDVTDRKKAETLLVQTERYKAVADLASGVAHNFNNLLQIVLGNASLAQLQLQSGDFSNMGHQLEEIIESSRFGAEVVRRLNSFAGGDTDTKVGEPEVFDLSDVVGQSVEMTTAWWKTNPEKRGVSVNLNKDLEDDCLVRGDRNQLFQVLVNLIKNAAEAVSGGGIITVATSVEDDRVILTIRDTGVGIPEKDLNRLFTPFFTTKLDIGTGLGLATSQQIVDAHGGEIAVESAEDEGSTFTVRLPLAQELPGPVEVREEPAAVKPLTILAIDNMEATVEMLRTGLEMYQHVVFGALSGEEGLRILKENPVDLVICDLGMPEMNGWQVGKAMKHFCEERGVSKVPFIMLTGWGDQSGEEEKMAKGGVDAVVEKPVDVERLLEVIRQVVEKRSLPH